jgi:hypothetical protein
MKQEHRLEEALEIALERLRGGEPLDAVVRDYPEHGDELRALLAPAERLARAEGAAPEATPGAYRSAMTRMQAELETQRAAREAPTGLAGLLAGWRGRSLAFRTLAVVAAVVVFGGAGLGASAATGNTPEPVRTLLRLPSDSTIKVEMKGTLLSMDAATIGVEVDGQHRFVVLTSETEFKHGRSVISPADFVPGDFVEVKGRLLDDDSIVALEVKLEGDGAGRPDHAPGPPDDVPGRGPPDFVPRGPEERGRPDGVPRGRWSDGWLERLPEPAQTAIAAQEHRGRPTPAPNGNGP